MQKLRSLSLDWPYLLQVLPATDMFCPIGSDDYIVFSGDVRKTAAQFARFSKHDGDIYPQCDAWLN